MSDLRPEDPLRAAAEPLSGLSARETSAGLVYWHAVEGPQWMNGAARGLFGIDRPDGLVDGAGWAAAAPGEPGTLKAFVDHLLSSGAHGSMTVTRRNADGGSRWLDVEGRPLLDPSGVAQGVVLAIGDARARVESERLAGARERRLQSTFAALREGVVVQAPSGEIVQCNPAAERILGLSADQMVGRTSLDPLWQATHPDGSPFPGDAHPAMVALRTGQPQRGVAMSVLKPDGSHASISVNAEPVFDAGPEPAAVIATFVDVTEFREAERRTQALLDEVSDLYHFAPCGYHTVAPDGTFADINATELGWLGLSRDDVVGKRRLTDFMTAEGQALFEATFPRLVRGEAAEFAVELDLVGPSGQRRRVMARGAAQHGPDGAFTRARTVLLDVTELRKTEGLLEESRRVESLGRVTGGIAHEFNNLLLAIIGLAELAYDTVPERSSSRGDLRSIIDAARRGARLLGQLATYARQQVTAPIELPLADVVGEVVDAGRARVGPGVDVTVRHESPPIVRIDRRSLEDAVTSLFDNAAEAVGHAGAITVATGLRTLSPYDVAGVLDARPGVHAFVSVTDNGPGMPSDVLARATEPFFTTKPFGSGAGLGLSTVSGVAAQAGGWLALSSDVDRGTTATLYLPVVEPSGPLSNG